MLMQTFEGELRRLQDEMLVLGSMVESAIPESVDVLKRRDLAASQNLIVLRQRIKKKRFAIEMDCVDLISSLQSLDGDLRTVSSILEIATELERIGDYATDVAMSPFMVIIEEPLPNLLGDIQRMAAKTQNMVHRALQAFAQRDLAGAQAIGAENDEVDVLYHQVYRDLLAFVKENSRVKGNSRALINQARYLAQIARHMECIADQVVHICDWVTFAVTGEMRKMDADRVLNSSPSNPGNRRRGNARVL
jgi:phosphate transport system protein